MTRSTALYCETFGSPSNPCVVFLHGFMGRGSDWKSLATELADAHFGVAVDLPGHGRSHPSGSYGLEAAADAVMATLDALQIGACSLVGYSMGGRLALYTALTFPARVHRVVLESASPGLRTETERAARRTRDEALATALEREPLDAFLQRWYNQPLFESLQRCEGLRERLIGDRLANDPFALAKSLREMGLGSQPSLWERLSQHLKPTLLVAGGEDAKFCAIAEAMASVSPVCRMVIVSGCGHNVHCENPPMYTRLVKGFLAEG